MGVVYMKISARKLRLVVHTYRLNLFHIFAKTRSSCLTLSYYMLRETDSNGFAIFLRQSGAVVLDLRI